MRMSYHRIPMTGQNRIEVPQRAVCALPLMALDGSHGQDHPSPSAEWRRNRVAPLRGGERTEVPVNARAHRGERLQRWLAGGFALLLVIAPFTRASFTVHLAAVVAASTEVTAVDDAWIAQAKQPAAGLRPAKPSTLGILSRPSSLEPPPGLPPVKSSLLRPGTLENARAATPATAAFGGDVGPAFHRSSVGTARTPTGPPA
jgi:hypothetical protein